MSGTLNKVFIGGRIGHDVELRYTKAGTAVTTIRVATDEYKGKDDDGNAKEETEWHSVVVWGSSAEYINSYGGKGSYVLVEGSNQTRSYGEGDEKKYVTEVKAKHISLIGNKKEASSADEPTGAASGGAGSAGSKEEDDDLPF